MIPKFVYETRTSPRRVSAIRPEEAMAKGFPNDHQTLQTRPGLKQTNVMAVRKTARLIPC